MEKERDRERQRERERETDRDREREREKIRKREREKELSLVTGSIRISETKAEVVAEGPAPSPCIILCPTGLPSMITAFKTPSILAT